MTREARRALREALLAVDIERRAQAERWGDQLHSPAQWLAILTEEVGEVAKELADARLAPFRGDAYRTELVQVAAVAVAAVEAYDRSTVTP